MHVLWMTLFTLVLLGIFAVALAIRARNMEIWLGSYLFRRKPPKVDGPVHVMFCFVDHFEPAWGKVPLEQQRARVDRWCQDYRLMAADHRDADGRHPQHSFFYPEEEYLEEHLDKLAALCADGFGEIEIHLHHDNDTPANFRATIARFNDVLHGRHGALPRDPRTGELRFAFIHGNWCLDNSRRDGRWCGINNEIELLRDLGCYADFTLPSAPSDTQTRTINSIYYATDDPARPKSHNTGVPVKVGVPASGDLMIIQGPLGLNWRDRRYGVIPRIESSDVRRACPPTPERVDAWVRTGIHVEGRPEWIFIKVHTHGTQERDMDTLLGPAMHAMHQHLETRYNDGKRYVLHYVTARETYNIIKAAEAGKQGNPNDWRDFELAPPTHVKADVSCAVS
ncbi:hypothetical protein EYV96_16410 [Dyella terrae]|uniref:Uncharacterized protein n=3 Tax=Rhodanobacteraceae TaxID=1775411 RepID=A0A4R0YDX2_9GAMM|nr:hypothetical protein EYV96_16410 [Dyella terrae]TCI06276.1 hypothetical protein EZM97_35500 [Dyella soli]